MNTTITPAGFVIVMHNGPAIWGCGDTEANAWVDFRAGMDGAGIRVVDEPEEPAFGEPEPAAISDYRAAPATAALVRHVMNDGGDISWRIVDGIACTQEEEDAA